MQSPMRVLVLSDSHGYTGRLGNILMAAEAGGRPDAVIHLGDGYHDLAAFAADLPPVYQVAGNCDLGHTDYQDVLSLGAARVFVTHGHLFHVKLGLDALLARAAQEKAFAALFGHTHRPFCETRSGILLLNPGAAMDGHYAVLTVSCLGAVDAQLF